MSFDSGLHPSDQLNVQKARMIYTDIFPDSVFFWDGMQEHALGTWEEAISALSKFGIDIRHDFSSRGINKRQGKKGPHRRNRKHRRR